MTPPLDSAASPAPRSTPSRVVAPVALVDLRAGEVEELRYPATSVLVFAGVPGAGKSTALHRFFAAGPEAEQPVRTASGALVLDSNHTRNRLRHRLGWLPYPLWRPLVHLAHYRAIRRALRTTDGPVAIHDCATFGWSRELISRWAEEGGRELHMVLIDVPATEARHGQITRGRRVNSVAFTAHCRRWDRLMRSLSAEVPPNPAPLASASVVIVDRPTLSAVARITFEAA
ncbi:ATP-binding protein [Nocardia neocaledoniensis NBRC 108232]|uniref:AAA domain-containing protein n=1 Tax=Nocardia neocaledoniensis TaxID=236511 RepID=A0A317NDE6_9NOCA|nr:ATP-binding protein [Nocardia neocaledoniensis]PWV72864.1 AAA domain-containing protein [Nocardia neocaledoniensis]GEM34883.1 ATP-binding protein [Nocardia neocaledoniensis NBRC 108232]